MRTIVSAPGRPAGGLRRRHGIAICTVVASTAVCLDASPQLSIHPVVAAVDSAVTWLGHALGSLGWPVALCLVIVSGLHYVAAATSARAAACTPLPFGELVAAQFAAPTANRVTPAGLGGASLLGRYFHRRGRLSPAQAAAAVTTLSVFGAVADVLAFAVLVGLSVLAGFSGAAGEIPTLVSKLAGLIPLPANAVGAIVVAGAAAALGAGWYAVGRRSSGARVRARVATAAVGFARALADLARRPRRLAVLMSASAGTTLVLAAGFAAAATLSSAAAPTTSFAGLMIGYMVASAAGSALPTPGGIGTTDAALVGVLVAAHVAAGPAVAIVLAFRLITFWAPAAVGALLIRPLRRNGAL